MVRKSLISLFVVLAVSLAMPMIASADSVYDEGNISTTYITIFRDISSNISPLDDYVFFRSGQYEYKLVVGDLDYSGSFTGTNCESFIITTNSGFSNNYIYTLSYEPNFSLSPGSALVYSNLGHYPDLYERGDYYAMATVLLLLIGVCLYLTRSIFSFCFRNRH